MSDENVSVVSAVFCKELCYNVMSAKEKEAAAKQTFTFLALINEQNILQSRMGSAKHGFCESVKKDMQRFQKRFIKVFCNDLYINKESKERKHVRERN